MTVTEQSPAAEPKELKEGKEGAPDEGMDTYDLASEERDREINLILSDRDRDKLQAIAPVISEEKQDAEVNQVEVR